MAKILIVDDAVFMRNVIRNILQNAGYTDIVEAEDGITAVERYKANRPDLVLLDITMPRMDGCQTLKAILACDSNAKVIICTAVGQQRSIASMIEAGAREYIVKPFNASKMIQTIERQLDA